jgi:3-methyladenine DNA glycosylase/8-oxoguanine DNA glycosylase
MADAPFQLSLRGPGGEPVDLGRTINSHGFAGLAPMRLNEAEDALSFTVRVTGSKPRRVQVSQGAPGFAEVAVLGRAPGARARRELETDVRRVLRLDEDLSGFYAQVLEDPDLAWAAAGAGRMLRGPSVFEDVVKTVCTTNCTWSATVRMVDAIVAGLGEPAVGAEDDPRAHAFPTPRAMAGAPASFYRDRVRAGYRGPYLIELARRITQDGLDLEALASPEVADDDVEAQLLALPGVGPYAAAHIMMTLGRNSRLILDSWTRPTYTRIVGRRSLVPDATIRRRFRRYGDQAGLAFWLFVTRDWLP